MLNRTLKNDPQNKGHNTKETDLELLTPLWQGLMILNITFSDNLDFDPAELEIVYLEPGGHS